MKAPSQRQLRVGGPVRHALAEIFREGMIHDPTIEGLVVTVSEVRMTPDLKPATVFVMLLGDQGAGTLVAAVVG